MMGMQAVLSISLALLLLTPTAVHAQRRSKTKKPSTAKRIAIIAKSATLRPIGLSRRDCSGFIETVLARAGVPRRGNTKSFYFEALREKRLSWRPRAGDLVFFDRTYDRNGNGLTDDSLTHIAIVTSVERDGTIVMAHRGNSGQRALRMNLKKPSQHRDPRSGKIHNDFLAEPGFGHRRLTGQVFRAFARPPRR